jgi:type II secretory pathway component PulF
MRDRPDWFDTISCSLVSAGEVSGAMGPMLERMAALTRKQLHLRSSVVGALVYPCLLIGVSIIVLVSMLLFVLPRFAGLFKTLGSPLPPTTQALFWLSGMLQSYWWATAPPIVLLLLLVRVYARSPKGRVQVQTAVLHLPKIGKIARSLIAARLARLFGTLLESQVPLLEALQLTQQSAVNIHYAQLFARAEEVVSQGEPVSAAFADTNLLSPSIVEAIRNGEQSGRIGAPLLQVSDFLDEENEILIRTLTGILEPAILVILGLIVGGVALSMFLPLFDLAASASGG